MSDPTPIKALDWHGFLRILAAHDTQTTLSANTISADALDGVQIDRKRLGALFKAAADAGYITDFGDVCRVELTKWTDTLTEDQARELGSALIGWAGRKRISRRAVGA